MEERLKTKDFWEDESFHEKGLHVGENIFEKKVFSGGGGAPGRIHKIRVRVLIEPVGANQFAAITKTESADPIEAFIFDNLRYFCRHDYLGNSKERIQMLFENVFKIKIWEKWDSNAGDHIANREELIFPQYRSIVSHGILFNPTHFEINLMKGSCFAHTERLNFEKNKDGNFNLEWSIVL